jgi:hypothetical protein
MNSRSVFCSLMLAIFLATAIDARPIRAPEDEISASEAQEAREIAQRVLAEIQRTRDLRPLYRAAFKDDKDSQQPLVHGIAALYVTTKVREEAGFDDLEHFLFSTSNIDYLGQLYAFSHYLAANIDMDNMRIDQAFPPHVRSMILENATLSNWWNAKGKEDRKKISSVSELDSVSNTLDRASMMMREYFSKNPPEQTELYQQNLALVKDRLMKPCAITEFIDNPNPEGSRYIRISVPVLVLFLGTKDGHQKLSMMAASVEPF